MQRPLLKCCGKTWEVNWINQYTRASEGAR
jgi:hypothetical protein